MARRLTRLAEAVNEWREAALALGAVLLAAGLSGCGAATYSEGPTTTGVNECAEIDTPPEGCE